MSTHPPSSLNPSQAVERIREIIVGRQLDRLEQRVSRLEAHLEAVVKQAEQEREENQRRTLSQQQDIQRLSAYIQQLAAEKTEHAPELRRLEERLGLWLTEWRDSFLTHLQNRECEMTRLFREEMDSLRRNPGASGRGMPDPAELELCFQRIAAAARALADCASPPTIHHPHIRMNASIRTPLPVPSHGPSTPVHRRPLPSWPGSPSGETEAARTDEIHFPPLSAGNAPAEATAAPEPSGIAKPMTTGGKPDTGDFSDADLRDALLPLIGGTISPDGLEALLRSTLRRVLAEHSPAKHPFHGPGALDKFRWKFEALVSSRSYEEIIFEKTHRFEVDEVFVLDPRTLALISFASSDPARHASVKRVEATVHRLGIMLGNADGHIQPRLKLPDGRQALIHSAENLLLVTLVRGEPNELLEADLSFAAKRLDETFGPRLRQPGSALLHAIQPYLEDCLLIQAPASAA